MTDQYGFLPVGRDIYFSRGQGDVNSSFAGNSPTVILIFGWMSAKLPHLHKYTEVYAQRYPNAARILVACHPSVFWMSTAAQDNLMAPVVEVIEALECIPVSNNNNTERAEAPRILVHAFSNGGSYQLATLCRVLARRPKLSKPSGIISALIFDSCPGRGGLKSSYRAFTASIGSPLARPLVGILLALLICYDFLLSLLFGQKLFHQIVNDTLLDPKLLPWTDIRTPRLYVYSKKDEMVSWLHVEAHAEKARALGMNVRTELFESSPHVAHARADPSRYWELVDEVWEDAFRMGDQVMLKN